MEKKELLDSLKLFCDLFPRRDKYGEIDFGEIKIDNRREKALNNDLLRGDILEYFTALYISDDAMIGGEFMLDIYSINRVREDGYSGWNNMENSWIPIGNRNGDILFVKTKNQGEPVYGAIVGSFDPFFVSDSLSAFFYTLSKCMEMEQIEFNFESKDDTFAPKPLFLNRVSEIIESSLSTNSQKGFFDFFFG